MKGIADGYIQGGSTLVICALFGWLIIKSIPSVLKNMDSAITEFRAETKAQRAEHQLLISSVQASLTSELSAQRALFSETINNERAQRDAERQEYRVELAAERTLRATQQEAFLRELAAERVSREQMSAKFSALEKELSERRVVKAAVAEHPMHPDLKRRRENHGHHEREQESGG